MAIDRMKGWIDSIPSDVDALKKLVDADGPREARRVAAGALSYLVTRLDLIPDWEESCGVLDDAMVLRVAAAIATDKGVDASREVARLSNEADQVFELLGPELYARFKRHVEGLADQAVRGRTADTVLDDAGARKQLYAEIADELKKLPAATFADPAAVERTVKSYFSQKLSAK